MSSSKTSHGKSKNSKKPKSEGRSNLYEPIDDVARLEQLGSTKVVKGAAWANRNSNLDQQMSRLGISANECRAASEALHARQQHVNKSSGNGGSANGGYFYQQNPYQQQPYTSEDNEEHECSDDDDGSWMSWYCTLPGNEFFCTVDEDYAHDDFNLTGLSSLVPCYEDALDLILDVEPPMDDNISENKMELIESAAEMLYGLIHARYILSNKGMHAMHEKFRQAAFGRCPRVFCQGQPVLPVGLSDIPMNYTVNVFCPRCHDLFFPKSARQGQIDGAYFGTTFPHLFLMSHPECIPSKIKDVHQRRYVPKVYGFRINDQSEYFQGSLSFDTTTGVSSSRDITVSQQQSEKKKKNGISNSRAASKKGIVHNIAGTGAVAIGSGQHTLSHQGGRR